MQNACRPSPIAVGSLGGSLAALLEGNGRAQGVRPHSVFKSDGLYAADDAVHINALVLYKLRHRIQIGEAVLLEDALNLADSSFVSFKQ